MPYARIGSDVGAALLQAAFADLTGLAREEVEERVIFLDARRATDPESRGYAGHTGEHPMMLFSVASHGKRFNWFRALRIALHARRERNPAGDLYICMVCKSGKHRSVAMAILVQRLLRITTGYCPSAPVGFMHWSDLAKCGGAPRCDQCGQWDNPQVAAAVELAATDWNAARRADTAVEGMIY